MGAVRRFGEVEAIWEIGRGVGACGRTDAPGGLEADEVIRVGRVTSLFFVRVYLYLSIRSTHFYHFFIIHYIISPHPFLKLLHHY